MKPPRSQRTGDAGRSPGGGAARRDFAGTPQRRWLNRNVLGIGLADLVQVLDLERIVLAGRAVRDEPDVHREAVSARLEELLPQLYEREVEYLRREEFARSAEDILWRRSKLGLHLLRQDTSALERWLAADAVAAP